MLIFKTYKYRRSNFNQNDGTIYDIIITGNKGIPVVNWTGPNGFTAGPFNGNNRGNFAGVTEEGQQPPGSAPKIGVGDFYFDTNINKYLVLGNCGIGEVWDTFAPREDYGVNGSPRTNETATASSNWNTDTVQDDWYTTDSNNNVVPARTKILNDNGFPTAIRGNLNAPQPSGFMSDCGFTNYVHEFTLGSGIADDDTIGVILASFRDGENLYGDSGYTYTLSFEFTSSGPTPQTRVLFNFEPSKGFITTGGSRTNVIIRNFGEQFSPFTSNNYNQQGYVKVKVTRSGDFGELFKIEMTDTMGDTTLHPLATRNINDSNPYNPNYEINFSLLDKQTWSNVNTQPLVTGEELCVFLGSQRYGYFAASQGQARFFDISFSGSQNNITTKLEDSIQTDSQTITLGTDGCDCEDVGGNNITSFTIQSDGVIRGFREIITKEGTEREEVLISQECCEKLNGNWTDRPITCTLNRDFSITETNFCDRIFDYKIILNPEDNHGAIFDVDENESCSLTIGFDYLLEWDCTELRNCLDSYDDTIRDRPTIIDILSGATLTATIEKFDSNQITTINGTNLETIFEVPVLEVTDVETHITGNTGWLLTGNETDCTILNNQLISDLDTNCELLSGNTVLNSEWVKFEFKITDENILNEIKNESISLGIKVHSEFCEFNLLIDRIKLRQDCVKVVPNNEYINTVPSFNLTKVVDNKKSWVKKDFKHDRNYNLEYRNTCYDVNSGKLVVNSKELDIESSIASAIEESVINLVYEDSCFLDINESFTRNTNIYALFDTTSMRVSDGVAANNSLLDWFANFQLQNPSYNGNLYTLPVRTENYVDYAVRLNNGTLQSIASTSSSWSSLNTLPTDFDGETEAILLAFVDETHSQYHDINLSSGYNNQPRTTFVNDYNNFINIYDNYEFFRGIVYPIVRGGDTGFGAALALQLLSAIEGKTLSPVELSNIDTGTLDLSEITVNNPYSNFPLPNNTFMRPLKEFNWAGIYNKTSPAINVFNSNTFSQDLDDLLLGGYSINSSDIEEIVSEDLSDCNTGNKQINLLRDKLIDAKSRKVISSYPILRLLYDRYLRHEELCGEPINVLTYETVMNFVKLLGTQWVDLIEQVVPSTALWKSTNIYGNTIFDTNKFKYRNYSILPCNEPTSIDTSEHIFSEGGVEVFDISMETTIIDEKNCEVIDNSVTCDRVYAYGFNDASIFRGNVTITTLNKGTQQSGGDTITINENL